MNSYQINTNNNINNINQRNSRQNLNYVYNRCNQNIDHVRENFNNNPVESSPYQNRINYNRNNSNNISSILNNAHYNSLPSDMNHNIRLNHNLSADNSSNNYYSTKYSSLGNSSNINNINVNNVNNVDVNRMSHYSNFNNNQNNNNIYTRNSYQSMPINYPGNINMNSMNDINNSLRGSEVINFNGINYQIGSVINNNGNPYENNFRRSNYSQKNGNINIGNNNFNINLSSITSQDIFNSYDMQKKQNERKKKEEYNNELNKQVQEKNKRRQLEKQKKLQEDLKYEQKYENYYKQLQENEKKEENNKNNNINKNINNNEQIIKNNNINNNINAINEQNDLDKNILETIRKNQYPLINDINQDNNINNYRAYSSSNKKRNYKINDNSDSKISTTSSMIKSGLNIIEGNKNRGSSYDIGYKDKNIFNNYNINPKKVDNTNKETEDYLDQIIKKTDLLSQTLQKTQGNTDSDRMKELLKVLDNKINKYDNKNNNNNINKFTPIKNKNNNYNSLSENTQKRANINIDPSFDGINIGALKYHSKYENYDNNNNLYKEGSKINKNNQFNSNLKMQNDNQLEESMKGTSNLINSISKDNNEKYSNNNIFNNYNNKEDIMSFINQRKKDKKYILKDDILSKTANYDLEQNTNKEYNINNNIPNNDIIPTKDSLNSNMKLTFGENGNLKFSKQNTENNNQINESNDTYNKNSQTQSIKQFTFGENFGVKNNNDDNINSKKNKNIKEERPIKEVEKENENDEDNEDIDEDDEEKYDIKVNSENDINYDNMLKSTKKSDLKFLDFDNFCDEENETVNNKKNKKKRKKKKKINIKQKKNLDTNDEDICNIISEEEDNNDNNNNNDQPENKLTESKKIQNQLNFFSDSINKGISHKRNDKSIFKNNSRNKINEDKNDDEENKTISDFDNDNNNDGDKINILSKNQFDEMKKKIDKRNNDENNVNILEESDELKDSFCDDLLKNIDKYRGEIEKEE